MGVVAASFAAATCAVVTLSLPLGRRHPAVRAAFLLLSCWTVANLVPPIAEPWLDGAAYYAVLMIWGERPRRWLLGLAGLFLAQMVVHVMLFEAPWYRALALNVLFADQLLVVMFGTLDGLAALWRGRPDRGFARHLGSHSRASSHPSEEA